MVRRREERNGTCLSENSGCSKIIRKFCFQFIWYKEDEKKQMVLSSWKMIDVPKYLRGLWLKNVFLFSKSHVPKNSYRLIKGIGIWA